MGNNFAKSTSDFFILLIVIRTLKNVCQTSGKRKFHERNCITRYFSCGQTKAKTNKGFVGNVLFRRRVVYLGRKPDTRLRFETSLDQVARAVERHLIGQLPWPSSSVDSPLRFFFLTNLARVSNLDLRKKIRC